MVGLILRIEVWVLYVFWCGCVCLLLCGYDWFVGLVIYGWGGWVFNMGVLVIFSVCFCFSIFVC